MPVLAQPLLMTWFSNASSNFGKALTSHTAMSGVSSTNKMRTNGTRGLRVFTRPN